MSRNLLQVLQKFIPDFNLQSYYDFLDSLTLFEESAFLNIFIYILILLCIFSIMSVFFGNELIKYFKLEQRFPRLAIFFTLRTKFQRYYLMWNILYIFIISFLGIFINLLAFY